MPADDRELIAALRDDLDRGFSRLMVRYAEPVYWHVRRLVVDHADAEDAVQETFVRVYRSFSRFRGDTSLALWIYRIATREALRCIAQRGGAPCSLDAPGTHAAAVPAEAEVDYTDVEAVRLQRAIRALPARQQLVFTLRYYDELDYEEIARITDSNAAAAKASFHVAKEKIKKWLIENS